MNTKSDTISGNALLDSMDIQTHDYSPIFITGGPGIVGFHQPVLMPDGELYYSAFCSHWEVKVQGGLNNLQNSLQGKTGDTEHAGSLLGKYTLVGYVGGQPLIIVQNSQIRSWAAVPFISNRKVFNADEFYTNLQQNISAWGNRTSTAERSATGSMTEEDRSRQFAKTT